MGALAKVRVRLAEPSAAGHAVVPYVNANFCNGNVEGGAVDAGALEVLVVVDAFSEPFWEDRLFGSSRQRPVRFSIGSVALYGVNPCERCVVPSRDPSTSEAIAGFPKRFAQLREQTLPTWTSRTAFDHFYRLTVNTCIAPGEIASKRIQIGDEVRLSS